MSVVCAARKRTGRGVDHTLNNRSDSHAQSDIYPFQKRFGMYHYVLVVDDVMGQGRDNPTAFLGGVVLGTCISLPGAVGYAQVPLIDRSSMCGK